MTQDIVEKYVDEFRKKFLYNEIDCELHKDVTSEELFVWLRTTLTQAHQAGIDEAVERVNRKLSSTIGAVKMGVISQEQGYNEIIKTLQDNK